MKHAMLLILTLALVPGGLVQFTPPLVIPRPKEEL